MDYGILEMTKGFRTTISECAGEMVKCGDIHVLTGEAMNGMKDSIIHSYLLHFQPMSCLDSESSIVTIASSGNHKFNSNLWPLM